VGLLRFDLIHCGKCYRARDKYGKSKPALSCSHRSYPGRCPRYLTIVSEVAGARSSTARIRQLATLGDVRMLFDKHLPAEYRAKFGWRQLAALLRR
jgi:hypothetical protein